MEATVELARVTYEDGSEEHFLIEDDRDVMRLFRSPGVHGINLNLDNVTGGRDLLRKMIDSPCVEFRTEIQQQIRPEREN
jgi:hypothetical protein